MINCIVIDDEPLALRQIEQYANNTPSLELKGSFDSAIEALSFLKENHVDLIFVDINMPQLSGLEFVRALPFNVKVIFVTAYREYALEGFDLDAADYLLKPLSYASFLKSVEKVQQRYFSEMNNDKNYIFVRSDYKLVRINLNEIQYIESKREYMDFILDTGETVTIHGSLNAIIDRLPPKRFVRVHRSFIVNLEQIKIIERNSILFGKQYIPIKDQAREVIQQYLRNESL